MPTLNRICELQGWSDERVIRIAFNFLASEGLLGEFMDYLHAVAVEENQDRCEEMECPTCRTPLTINGYCSTCRTEEMTVDATEDSAMEVIGNRRTRRYHLSHDRHYQKACRSLNVISFETEHDARRAGYFRSSR